MSINVRLSFPLPVTSAARMQKNAKTRTQKRLYERQGRRAEALAVLYLRLRGYRILEKRYKTRLGEIDIIAARRDLIIMAEVKHRQTLGQAHDSLSAGSERRIRNAADLFIARDHRAREKGVRFDALFFFGPRPSLRRVEHIISAF